MRAYDILFCFICIMVAISSLPKPEYPRYPEKYPNVKPDDGFSGISVVNLNFGAYLVIIGSSHLSKRTSLRSFLINDLTQIGWILEPKFKDRVE